MRSTTSTQYLAIVRKLMPTLAAVVACIAVLPSSQWFARAVTSHSVALEPADYLHTAPKSLSLRDEPILPVPVPVDLDRRWVALGRALFHEPALSSTGDVSCASCHKIDEGGDDNRTYSEGVQGALGDINAPTVLNASLNFRQFWDGRAASLEEQVEGPIHNPIEMDSDWESVLEFLNDDSVYSAWFSRAFADGVTEENVVAAIAEYERSLVTPNSAFDRWLQGDDQALTDQQHRGYLLFKEFQCVGCHQGVNVGGNLFQPLGVMLSYFEDGTEAKQHLGRFNVTQDIRDKYVFKVPGLRNAAETAPYFHDGSAESLQDAVRAMATHQLGIPIDEDELAAICSFLQSLSATPNEDDR